MTSPGDLVDQENPVSDSLSIQQKFKYLGELVDHVYENLLKLSQHLRPDTLEYLDELSDILGYISSEIADREFERKDLLALSGIGKIINSSLHLDEVLQVVMDTIVNMTGAERGFLMLHDNNGEMSTHIARNWERETLEETEFAISRTVVNQVINECQPVLTTNAQQDPRFDSQDSIIGHNLRSILCVPLQLKGELIGVIYIDNRIRSGIFRKTHLRLLVAIADQAAVAIENARLFESIRQSLLEVTNLKNLMDDVFTSITSGVITIDEKDNITLSNQAAEVILGREQGSLIGQHISSILSWMVSDLSKYLSIIRDTSRQIVGLQYTPLIPNRGQVTLNLNLLPLKGTNLYHKGIAIVIEDQTEKKRLEAHRRLFERMVSPAVIEELEQNQVTLSGKRTFITTLFADIRDFTQFSEQHKPELLVEVLNRYLGIAVEAVLAHGGTVDKFQGDAIMAFFNAPLPQTDHVLYAVRAALDIQKSMNVLQKELPPEFCLSFGIGIHYGEAVLGLIGTEKRVDYTAIGDSVNTAKRLQENAAAGQILISASAQSQVPNLIDIHPVTSIQAKGKSESIKVYELLGLKSNN
jgi:adenylate cyclase